MFSHELAQIDTNGIEKMGVKRGGNTRLAGLFVLRKRELRHELK